VCTEVVVHIAAATHFPIINIISSTIINVTRLTQDTKSYNQTTIAWLWKGGHCPHFKLVWGGGGHAPGAPLLPPPMPTSVNCILLATPVNCTPICFLLMHTTYIVQYVGKGRHATKHMHTPARAVCRYMPLQDADAACGVCALQNSSFVHYLILNISIMSVTWHLIVNHYGNVEILVSIVCWQKIYSDLSSDSRRT
jgi:hypothetical protein